MNSSVRRLPRFHHTERSSSPASPLSLAVFVVSGAAFVMACSSSPGGTAGRDATVAIEAGAGNDAAVTWDGGAQTPADGREDTQSTSDAAAPVDSVAGPDHPAAADGPPLAVDGAGGPDGLTPDPNSCAAGGPVSPTPVLMAQCATEGELGYVQDGNIPFVCARGPFNALKPTCLLWRRGTWYIQTRGKVWNTAQEDLGRPCSTLGASAGFPNGTFLCSLEPKSQTLQWALSVGTDLLPYVKWDATETFLSHVCKPPTDTSNGSQFYRATVDIDANDPNTLYLNIEWIGPFRSRDGGATWAPFNIAGRALPARTVKGAACHGEYPGFAFDSKDPAHLYFIAGGAPGSQLTTPFLQGGGLWESTDSGAQFRWMGAPQLNQYVSSFVRVGDGKTLLWGTSSSLGTATGPKPPTPLTTGLIYRSDDSGGTWRELPTGLWPEAAASFLWVNPQKAKHYLLGVFQYLQRLGPGDARAPGMLESLDGGATWAPLPGLPYPENAVTSDNTVVADDGKFIFSCGFGSVRGRTCFRSENGGATFASVEAVTAVALDPLDSTSQRLLGYRLAGGTPTIPIAAAVMASVDGGRTWTHASALPTEHPGHIKWDPTVKNRVYLTGDAGAIFRSNDAGAHWTQLTTYLDFINVPRTD